MPFQFTTYGVSELEACGLAFVRHFASASLSGYPDWSAAVFDWFRATAAPGLQVYPPTSGTTKGEFIVDHCHTTYPLSGADEAWPSVRWYERAFEAQCQVKLALECEWGKWGKADTSLIQVMDDACKLAVLRASVKVIVFSSHWVGERTRVPEALAQLRTCHGDTDSWLWIDVPNEPSRSPWVARARSGTECSRLGIRGRRVWCDRTCVHISAK